MLFLKFLLRTQTRYWTYHLLIFEFNFNEPIVPSLSRIDVLTQAGQSLETGLARAIDDDGRILAVDLPSPLNDGAYLVSWQVLSAVDGHTTNGSFSFGVGEVVLTAVSDNISIQAQLSPLSTAARWLFLTGLTLLTGLFAFRLLVWNPILADIDLEEEEERVDVAHAEQSIKIGMSGLILMVVALVFIFIDQATTFNLLQLDNFQIWISTQFGAMWLIRLFLIAISHFNLSLFVDVKQGRQELRGWEWWAGLILTIGLAFTTAMISHSAALSRDTLQAIIVDWLHVLAATIWVGGLVLSGCGAVAGKKAFRCRTCLVEFESDAQLLCFGRDFSGIFNCKWVFIWGGGMWVAGLLWSGLFMV